jgi:hypothetical protein
MADTPESDAVDVQYRVGQVVEGHVLTEDGCWVALATSPKSGQNYWSRFQSRIGWVVLVVLGLLSLVVLPIPGLEHINLGLWSPGNWFQWLYLLYFVCQALLLIALPLGLVVAAYPARRQRR